MPYFCKETESFFDYLEDYIFVVDNVQRCKGKLESTYLEFNENYTAFPQRGDILPSQGKLLIDKEEFLNPWKIKM